MENQKMVYLLEEGLKGFFSGVLGKAIRAIKSSLSNRWERKYGSLEVFEFENFRELRTALSNLEIEGIADVRIKNACLSNFAPLYLFYSKYIGRLNEQLEEEAQRARTLYESLKKREGIKDNSLFMKAVKGEAKIDAAFRKYAVDKKRTFMNLSLARFEPLTENICYSAVFESETKLHQYTSPITQDVHLEPCIPLFYEISSPRGVEKQTYIDVEIHAKIMPLPSIWSSLLEERGIRILGRPYCLFVP
jgi:hypothetical protein